MVTVEHLMTAAELLRVNTFEARTMNESHILPAVLGLFALVMLVIVLVIVGWVLPITLGVHAARRKNYSPHWIACIVLLCITPRIRCPHCGGFVTVNFRICPYCHAGLDLPSSGACRPTQPPSS